MKRNFDKVLILTKSMITKNNYQNPIKKLSDFEREFNWDNLSAGKTFKELLDDQFPSVEVISLGEAI